MSENTPPADDPSPAETPIEPDAEVEDAPLNRAERRRRERGKRPGHVGPQGDPTRSGRGPRPHTKRQI